MEDERLFERLVFAVIAKGPCSGIGPYTKHVIYEAAELFALMKGYYYLGLRPDDFIEREIGTQI